VSDIAALVADNLDIWTGAIERKSGAGRGGGKRISLYGIERLRALILDLAVRGKLVPQDPADEPAIKLLPSIEKERQRRLKAKEIKNSKGPAKPSGEPFELPSGWIWLPLWQTGNIFTGNSINAAVRSELEANSEGWPFVATKDVGYGFEPIDYDNGLIVDFDDQRFNIARPNSVFICAEGGSAGRKMAVSDRAIAFGNKLIANEPWSQVDPRYVLCTYLSDFFFECFSKEMTGIIGGISRAKFLALPFPLPPLAEQRRIVAKVDELMALCDALERESADALAAHQTLVETLLATLVNSADAAELAANWARLESHFDTLFTTEASIDAIKQTILDLAVRGKLVEQDAANWPVEHLGKYVKEAAAGWSPKCIETPRSGDNWGVLKVSAVTWGWFQPEENKALPSSLEPRPEIEVAPGDFLISRANTAELVARSVVVPVNAPSKLMMSDKIIRFRFNDKIDPEYVNIVHASPFARAYYARVAGGTSSSMKNVSQAQIRALEIPIPPVAEQHRIVAKVEELMALCDAMKARLADAAETRRQLADAVVERAAA